MADLNGLTSQVKPLLAITKMDTNLLKQRLIFHQPNKCPWQQRSPLHRYSVSWITLRFKGVSCSYVSLRWPSIICDVLNNNLPWKLCMRALPSQMCKVRIKVQSYFPTNSNTHKFHISISQSITYFSSSLNTFHTSMFDPLPQFLSSSTFPSFLLFESCLEVVSVQCGPKPLDQSKVSHLSFVSRFLWWLDLSSLDLGFYVCQPILAGQSTSCHLAFSPFPAIYQPPRLVLKLCSKNLLSHGINFPFALPMCLRSYIYNEVYHTVHVYFHNCNMTKKNILITFKILMIFT